MGVYAEHLFDFNHFQSHSSEYSSSSYLVRRHIHHTIMPEPGSSSSSATPADIDIEKLLNREANAFQRELEVERILKAFKLKYVRRRDTTKITPNIIFQVLMRY